MSPQTFRLRTAPMILLAGIMIVASLIAAAPAAAAKAHPSPLVICFTGFPASTPGYPIQCQAQVNGFGPPITGTLKLSAASYKGSLSTNTCSSLASCPFQYTPKGKGSDHRKDTITAIYSGDGNYYSARSSVKISIAASPPLGLLLSCPDSTPSGTQVFCFLDLQVHGPTQFNSVQLKVPTYKGTVAPTECGTYNDYCLITYTPKGRGSDTRIDTITASYKGDLYNSPNKVTEEIHVTAAP
jgi:hypothetical protein